MQSMTYVFFASYARLDNNRFARLIDVVGELRDRVRAKLGASATDQIGFVDSSDILTGQEWETRLASELHSARVLVCFMSPTYFNSEWCTREFAVFRQRVDRLDPPPPVVIPVLWERGAIPQALSRLQFKDDRLPDKYQKDGLAALKRVKGASRAYWTTMDVLADIICDAARYELPPLRPLLSFRDLPRSFDNPGVGGVMLAVLHPQGPQWSFGIAGSTVARSIESVAQRLRIPWREIVMDNKLVDNIATLVSERRMVVIVTDEAQVELPIIARQLETLDAKAWAAIGILVATSADPAPGLLGGLFPKIAAARKFQLHTFSLNSSNSFVDKLESVVSTLQRLRIEQQPVSKAMDPQLAEQAERDGIPITTRPILQGPGATP